MTVLEFRRRPNHKKGRKLDWVTMLMAAAAMTAVGALGYVVIDQFKIPMDAGPLVALVSTAAPAQEQRVHFEMCSGSNR